MVVLLACTFHATNAIGRREDPRPRWGADGGGIQLFSTAQLVLVNTITYVLLITLKSSRPAVVTSLGAILDTASSFFIIALRTKLSSTTRSGMNDPGGR